MTIRVSGTGLLPRSSRKPGAIAAVCRKALKSARTKGPGELNDVFVSRRRMLEINKRYLDHDYDTDVIAFQYDRPRKNEDPFGDVFISVYMARRQAKEMKHSVLAELLTLAVHGTLHLLGHDDSTPRKKASMFRRQDSLLRGKIPPG